MIERQATPLRGALPALAALLAACSPKPAAPPAVPSVFVSPVRNDSGATQRVLFDPAGSFRTDILPERNDVVFGMTPAALDVYVDYHARVTFDVVLQDIPVSPEVAARALALVQAHGPAPQATCAIATSGILRQVGLDAPATWFPRRLMTWADGQPGVTRRVIQDDDSNENRAVLATAAQRLN